MKVKKSRFTLLCVASSYIKVGCFCFGRVESNLFNHKRRLLESSLVSQFVLGNIKFVFLNGIATVAIFGTFSEGISIFFAYMFFGEVCMSNNKQQSCFYVLFCENNLFEALSYLIDYAKIKVV